MVWPIMGRMFRETHLRRDAQGVKPYSPKAGRYAAVASSAALTESKKRKNCSIRVTLSALWMRSLTPTRAGVPHGFAQEPEKGKEFQEPRAPERIVDALPHTHQREAPSAILARHIRSHQ